MKKEQKRIFSKEQLAEMSKHPGQIAFEALAAGDCKMAKEVCQQFENCHKAAPCDTMVVWNAQTLRYLYKEFGFKYFEVALKESIMPWFRPIAELFRNGVTKEAVSVLAQICRVGCGNFEAVEEDDDKIVFRLNPCGSGGRLVLEGHYQDSFPLPIPYLKESGDITENRSDFPIYCTKCKMAEILMIEWLGYPAFVLDCDPQKGAPSLLTIYKDPKKIPEKYFSRVGQIKKELRINGAVSIDGGMLFSQEEKDNLPLQYCRKAANALDNGQIDLAKGYCQLWKGEWFILHHILRDWVTGQLSSVYRHHGVEKVYEAEWEGYNKFIKNLVLDGAAQMGIKEQLEFLALAFTQHAMHFKIEEDEEKFTLITQPCGSGGRLMDEGGYDLPKNFARIKEKHKVGYFIEDFPIYCCHCPTTNEMIFENKGPYFLMADGENMKKPEDGCVFYIFKNEEAVPERLYKQVGMEKPF